MAASGTVSPESPPELYHLTDDPGEKNNLASAHPEKVRELQALLHHFSSSL